MHTNTHRHGQTDETDTAQNCYAEKIINKLTETHPDHGHTHHYNNHTHHCFDVQGLVYLKFEELAEKLFFSRRCFVVDHAHQSGPDTGKLSWVSVDLHSVCSSFTHCGNRLVSDRISMHFTGVNLFYNYFQINIQCHYKATRTLQLSCDCCGFRCFKIYLHL